MFYSHGAQFTHLQNKNVSAIYIKDLRREKENICKIPYTEYGALITQKKTKIYQ